MADVSLGWVMLSALFQLSDSGSIGQLFGAVVFEEANVSAVMRSGHAKNLDAIGGVAVSVLDFLD